MRARTVATILAAVLLLSGCATYNTAQHIRPWGDETHGMDRIDRVTAAYREANGDIRICVRGDPAERAYTTAVLFPEVDYSFLLPAGLYETGSDRAPQLHRTKDPVPEFNLTAAEVQGRCPEAAGSRTAIEVRRVVPADLGVESFVFADHSLRQRLFDAPPDGPVVFEFVDMPSSGLYYRGESPVFDGSRMVEVDLALRKKEPRPVWILMLPLALAYDVVTSPVQLYICLFSVGCAT